MTAAGHVDVVVCMDTEGPCADPASPDLLAGWDDIDRAVDRLFDERFRSRLPDPAGGHLRFGWFFLTWTGFRTNPRSRDFGYHRIRDHYRARWGSAIDAFGDEECWHYHQPSASGVGNEWGLDWGASHEYEAIVSRQLLERSWFPVCYRAGGTIMSPESSRWVDRWFPFDYSNRAPLYLPGLVDWSPGVAEWTLYHPDPEDFRRPGAGRRRMARCLDLVTEVHVLGEGDVGQAFAAAEEGRPGIVACFDHDYRDIVDRLDRLRELVHAASVRHPRVKWRYAAPVSAARRFLGAPRLRRLELEAAVAMDGTVHLWSSEPLYQSIPWLAVRTSDDEIVHVEEGLLRLDETRWAWTPTRDWSAAAFGGSTDLGEAAVAHVEPTQGPGAAFLAQTTTTHPRRPRSIWEHTKRYTCSAVARSSGEEQELDAATQARELLAGRVGRGDSVLDVGCGAGHLWRSLRPLGVEYHGIDPYRRAIEIGRLTLADTGLTPGCLRPLAIEELPSDERYDAVVSLSTLLYAADFRLPLEAMAGASRHWLVVRSSFAQETEVRYLEDILLEPGFEAMRAYFSIFARDDVQRFLEQLGFEVSWVEDRRQRDHFGGEPEVVGGIALPYEFLVAERR